jgi:ribonuclease HI
MAEWRENQIPTPVDKPEHWTMYFDGSLKLDGGGAGVLFISPRCEQLKYVLQILWEVSNNEAEYEALLHGLRLAISLGIKRLLVYGDSFLVVQQVNKEWDCNKEKMDAYVQEVRKLENKFSGLEVHQLVREHNVGADILSKVRVYSCTGSSGSLRPGVKAAIHQVLTSGKHRCGPSTA